VFIHIKDTGSGIDSSIILNLFSKFVLNQKEEQLWDYISKRIIEVHGGKTWAQNNKNGERGAIFSFILPLTMQ
jgi:K+-sensing histidine kinase KdpD